MTARVAVGALGALAALAGCGDNAAPAGLPLGAAHDLAIVAHQDDDLLFMQPDLSELVQAGGALTVVYVTAGDASAGVAYADSRVVAVESAYATMAGQPAAAWSCGFIDLVGHAAQHCRLADAAISLVFLGYPDGGIAGDRPESLLHLWEGTIAGADTVAHRTARYDQAGLIAVVAEVIATTRPASIHALDVSATHGADHADHLIVGALSVLARAASGSDAGLTSYRGYDDGAEPANLVAAVFDRASLGFRAYEACQIACGACEQTPCEHVDNPSYDAWLHRRYAVGTRQRARGRLALGDRCAVVGDAGAIALGACAGAPTFALDPAGSLRGGGGCAVVAPTGALGVGDCGAGPDRSFVFDDEGHLWAGLPPAPVADMLHDHGLCLGDADGQVRAELCGARRDPRWTVIPAMTTQPRALTGAGRAVRLGMIDRAPALCQVEAGALRCAAAAVDGGFAAIATRVDRESAPLAVEPESLALGDVDHDGRGDACGRDAGGLLCATAASGFAATRWTAAFAHAGAPTLADRTLSVFDRGDGGVELCALTDAGLACAAQGAAAVVVSARPAGDAALVVGDLDDDGRDDWCVATPAGPACAVAAQRALTGEAAPWAFSLGGAAEGSAAVDGAIATPARAALVDVSGDGRADLCTLLDSHVDCALSQGRGFGPRATALRLPSASHPTALWAGDVDGVGELCVDDGPDLVCARF